MTETATPFSAPPGTPPLVQLNGIAKYFPGVIANEDVDLDVLPGEIHALLGENGAGKSTLMNILTGIYQPDAGEIIIDGYAKQFATPLQAIAAGIGMVHQHFKLVQAFTVAENIHLGWSETPRRASAQVLEARTAALAAKFNLQTRPGARVSDLSTGEQQRVEILRVLARQARVLILDEPTAVLTPAEARELFKALRDFVAQGNAVIFISHKLDEVLEISDRISILRGGRKIVTQNTADCNPRMLAKLMVGRDIVLADMRHRAAGAAPISPEPVLSLDNVSALNDAGNEALHGVSLQVHAGEILGIAGVAGNGQRELSQVLAGMRPISDGRILVQGTPVGRSNAAAFVERGIGHIPEDRLHSGLAPALSITVNAVMREYKHPPVSSGGAYRPSAATALAKEIAAVADVAIPDFGMPIRNLSGGNQQRLVARREMRIANKVLIAAYPSRGLDVGAINTMLRYIVELRDAGTGIVLISEELEELLNLSDRIAVLYEGKVMGIVENDKADIDQIGLMMGGRAQVREVA
ncbi:ABC transporter ATP-binding protein [Rhizobium rhizogenes]|uniref:ABC transporter ATP-binding protein n=1 Tax=Rhizobium rhizogenes TaxID=359 RepID=UPI00055A833F|nr:ABC transporter ATP-binding protein [Rhizobium rhizogenes]KAA6482990.1 ABC transporter ATP-binding protein [Agrobacterium sp. ICMP 7243]OCJ02075.1 heme ABC transporter ATP-binding protein [Agrobacterium sp. 13-626]NTF51912.1 ABC transporter ATP-binding protein [Rhizobium rhizogenes]NTF84612.1 ABC transporter ATP-binding protein [Rhizobium rhizogenes]NTG17455.1 ABC transporter ATP-binding protein [Rhizobium rhizogenes]